MKKPLLFLGALWAITSHQAFAGPAACAAHLIGETAHWAIAVCQQRAQTDDFENPTVQKCIDGLIKKDKINMEGAPNCSLNAKYKKQWCRSTSDSKQPQSVEACVKSPEAIPKVVRNGGA